MGLGFTKESERRSGSGETNDVDEGGAGGESTKGGEESCVARGSSEENVAIEDCVRRSDPGAKGFTLAESVAG